jgi:hypothetical protein
MSCSRLIAGINCSPRDASDMAVEWAVSEGCRPQGVMCAVHMLTLRQCPRRVRTSVPSRLSLI